jgi:small conductance mechanosensitive channel
VGRTANKPRSFLPVARFAYYGKMTSISDRLNVDALVTQFVAWLPRLVLALVILLAFWLFWRFSRSVVMQVFTRAGLDQALARMLLNVYHFSVMIFALIMASNQIGIDVAAALTGLGVVGLTIGFAARDSLSNIMAGFLILWDKPFRSGDWVTLGDKYGKVEEITMRTTRLVTWNNTWIIIPNQNVINEVLVNHSANGPIRLEVPISIMSSVDLAATRKALIETVRGIDGVLPSPAPTVVVRSLETARIHLFIYAWVAKGEDEMPVQQRILEASNPLLAKTLERQRQRSAS